MYVWDGTVHKASGCWFNKEIGQL